MSAALPHGNLADFLMGTDTFSTREKARVVTVSSSANYLVKDIDFEAKVDRPKERLMELVQQK